MPVFLCTAAHNLSKTPAPLEHRADKKVCPINGRKEKSDIGAVFTVNDNNSLHSDTPWATCIAHVDGAYYVMNPKTLERITAGR